MGGACHAHWRTLWKSCSGVGAQAWELRCRCYVGGSPPCGAPPGSLLLATVLSTVHPDRTHALALPVTGLLGAFLRVTRKAVRSAAQSSRSTEGLQAARRVHLPQGLGFCPEGREWMERGPVEGVHGASHLGRRRESPRGLGVGSRPAWALSPGYQACSRPSPAAQTHN